MDITGRDIARGEYIEIDSGLPAGTGKSHADGWDHYLARLATAASGEDPGSDPWATITQGGG